MANDDFNVEDLETGLLDDSTTDAPKHAAADEPTPLADEAEAAVNGTAEAEADAEAQAAAEKAAAERAAIEAAEKEAEAKRLYDSFIGATETALKSENRDSATGTLPEVDVQPIKDVYLSMTAKVRKAALAYAQEKMQEKLLAGEIPDSRTYLQIYKALNSAKPQQIVKEPVDPTDAFVSQVVAMRLAGNFMVPPAGIAADWAERVQALGREMTHAAEEGGLSQVQVYLNWLAENEGKEGDDRSAEPEVHAAVKQAAMLARGRGRVAAPRKAAGEGKPKGERAPRVSDGTRRDIGKHIAEAFASHPVGHFLSVGEIAKFSSTEYAGTDGPSQGAINARLFPASGNCKLTFVRPEGPDQGRPQKGAVKTA